MLVQLFNSLYIFLSFCNCLNSFLSSLLSLPTFPSLLSLCLQSSFHSMFLLLSLSPPPPPPLPPPQGMTLDCAEMSFSRVFEAGQVYVALSRAKNLQGLRVLDFNAASVRAHPDVLKFYHNLRRAQHDYL